MQRDGKRHCKDSFKTEKSAKINDSVHRKEYEVLMQIQISVLQRYRLIKSYQAYRRVTNHFSYESPKT